VLSIYTWLLSVYMYPSTGMARLLYHRLSDYFRHLNVMEQLRNKVLDLIGCIKVPKAVIAPTFLKIGVFLPCTNYDEGDETLTPRGEIESSSNANDLDFLAIDIAMMMHSEQDASTQDTPFSRQLRRMKENRPNDATRGGFRIYSASRPGGWCTLLRRGSGACVGMRFISV